MQIDRLLIKQRLAFIKECLLELEDLSKLPESDFLNKRTAAAAESFLRRSLEAIFDIGRHILARSGSANMAMEYKGIAQGLGEANIITGDLQEQLVKMAGYRNRLVHLYYQISDKELYQIIKNNLHDIREFIEQMTAYISEVSRK